MDKNVYKGFLLFGEKCNFVCVICLQAATLYGALTDFLRKKLFHSKMMSLCCLVAKDRCCICRWQNTSVYAPFKMKQECTITDWKIIKTRSLKMPKSLPPFLLEPKNSTGYVRTTGRLAQSVAHYWHKNKQINGIAGLSP